jgi:hypothetical protein
MSFTAPPHAPGVGTGRPPLERVEGFGTRPVWMAFEYVLATPDRSARAVIWRRLRALRALNLKQGAWAVVLCDGQRERLLSLAEWITASGGTASMTEVGYEEQGDRELQSRLNRACERLWDDFFNEADFFPMPGASDTAAHDEATAALGRLRSLFADIVVRDSVQSDAGRVAAERLDALSLALAADAPVEPRLRSDLRCRVEVGSAWHLCSGLTRCTAVLAPDPSQAWDLAFQRFEDATYLPSDARVPLRHGTFTWTSPPGEVAAGVKALEERVSRFQQCCT